MELIEKWFLTNVITVLCHCDETLDETNEHFRANDSVSAYAKYVSGKQCSSRIYKTCRKRNNEGLITEAMVNLADYEHATMCHNDL